MKASDLVKIIRKVVKEEISLAIRKELRPIIKEVKLKAATRTAKKPVEKVSSKNFTSDDTLNSILNETAQQQQEYKTMGGGEYTSNMAQNFRAANPMSAFGNQKPTIDNMIPDDRRGREIPDALANAPTKDYSALVKSPAFNKRAK